jgi:hypothetical protein
MVFRQASLYRISGQQPKVNLALSGNIDRKCTGTKELYSIPVIGFNIPKIARLSFGPAFGLGWGASLKGGGMVSWGTGVMALKVEAETYGYLGNSFLQPDKRFPIYKKSFPLYNQCFAL